MKGFQDVKHCSSFQNWRTCSRNRLHYMFYKRLNVQNRYTWSVMSGEQVFFLFFTLPSFNISRNMSYDVTILPAKEHACVVLCPLFNRQSDRLSQEHDFKRTVRWNNSTLTLILQTWRIWWVPNNASKWQMGFNSEFKGLKSVESLIPT